MTKLTVNVEKPINKPSHYRAGTFFLDTKYGNVYILAYVSCDIAAMIGLDGNRFFDAVKIKLSSNGILLDEFYKIVDGQVDRFVALDNVEVKVW